MRELDLIEYKDQSSTWFPYLNGSEFQKWDNLPDEIRSRLRPEHKFTTMIEGFQYTVKEYTGKWLVFRRKLNTTSKTSKSHSHACLESHLGEIEIRCSKCGQDYTHQLADGDSVLDMILFYNLKKYDRF